jgi:hypothetical protein
MARLAIPGAIARFLIIVLTLNVILLRVIEYPLRRVYNVLYMEKMSDLKIWANLNINPLG